MAEHRFSEKQRRFCDAYLGKANGNGREAARGAGYKGNDATLATTAYRLLRMPKIQEYIAKQQDRPDRLAMGRDERQAILAEIARGKNPEGWGGVEPHHRIKALELLGKMGGDYIDIQRSEVEITERKPLLITGYEDEEIDAGPVC